MKTIQKHRINKTQLTNPEEELLLRKKRAVVLAIATRTGIHDTNDWTKFNRFMLNSSVLHKSLKDYNLPELNRLIQQFRRIEENYNKSAEKPLNKAWWHRGKRLSSLN